MKNKQLFMATIFAASMGVSIIARAEETTMEKVEATTDKATNKIKKGYRKGKDKACEMVNGKMECAGKKIKHKVQNATDSMGTKADEMKDTVD